MKVFLSGPKTIHSLPDKLTALLDSFCAQNCEFIVGDCYGADILMQKYLHESRVEITNQNEPVIYLSPHFGTEWLGQIMLAFGITTNPVVRYDYSAHYHCFLDKEN